METVTACAARLGDKTAISWADHRIETLEANLASESAHLVALARAVLADPNMARPLATLVLELDAARKKATGGP